MNPHATHVLLVAITLSTSALAQEMPAPTLAVGDRWVYRESDLLTKNETGSLTETVTAADAAEYWIAAHRVAATWWRGDSVKLVHREQFVYDAGAADKRGRIIASNDAGCAYPWPLKVGTKFECAEDVVLPNGWKVRYDMKFAVEAAESVETPAGRFDTLRLVAKGFLDNQTTNVVSRQERIIWLAAAAKREVKQEIRTVLKNGQVFRVEGRELVEFKAGGAN